MSVKSVKNCNVFVQALLVVLSMASAAGAEIRCAGQPVVWKEKSNSITSRQNTLSASRTNKAWAVSRQLINRGDGCVSFHAPGKFAERVVGIARTAKVKAISEFPAAIHLRGSGRFSLVINGAESNPGLRYKRGDRFFIGVSQGAVEFRKNGKRIYRAAINTNSPLRLAATVRKAGAQVKAARIASGKCKRWLKNGSCGSVFPPTPGNTVPTPQVPGPTAVPTAAPYPTSAPVPTKGPTPVPTIASGTVYYVSPSGSDSNNGTSLGTAWRTVTRAAANAAANSTVYIRAGTYNEAVTINRTNVTFQGYPGDAMPLITYTTGGQTSTVLIGTAASGVTLRGLDLSGGYYALKFDSSWSNGGGGTGPQRITIDGCKLHDSGSHVVKVQPKSNYITIKNSEIYRSGRTGLEGQGVDAVNVDNMTVQDNYFHDTTHNCIFSKGGSANTIVERNSMVNCGWGGILLGQDTGVSFMDSATNPKLFECINCTARNNVIIGTGYTGIGSYSASNTKIHNNTILNAASIGQAGIFLSTATNGHSGPAGVNAEIRGNIVTMTSSNRAALSIAPNAYSGTPVMNDNVYYSSGGAISFIDNRGGGTRSFSAWKSATGQDANSVEASPNLVAPAVYGANVYPGASSPALNRSPNFSADGCADDYYGAPRPSGSWDAGAVQH